jgi:hypothetical protein
MADADALLVIVFLSLDPLLCPAHGIQLQKLARCPVEQRKVLCRHAACKRICKELIVMLFAEHRCGIAMSAVCERIELFIFFQIELGNLFGPFSFPLFVGLPLEDR